jgi:hypothetical protein
MVVVRSVTVAGLALGGAAFWLAVTDSPSTVASRPMDPPTVSRSVQLMNVSSPLVDPSCADPLCVMTGGGAAATPPRLATALLTTTAPLSLAAGTDPLSAKSRRSSDAAMSSR